MTSRSFPLELIIDPIGEQVGTADSSTSACSIRCLLVLGSKLSLSREKKILPTSGAFREAMQICQIRCQNPHYTLLHVDHVGSVPPGRSSNVRVEMCLPIPRLAWGPVPCSCGSDGSSVSTILHPQFQPYLSVWLSASRRDAKIFGVAELSHDSLLPQLFVSPLQEPTIVVQVAAVVLRKQERSRSTHCRARGSFPWTVSRTSVLLRGYNDSSAIVVPRQTNSGSSPLLTRGAEG